MAIVEMTLDSIRHGLLQDDSRAIILKTREGERYLAIRVGTAEADSISLKLQGVSTPRPLTHDLLCTIIHFFGGSVNSVIISDLKENTFYAKLVLNMGKKKFEIDCRPSDALALAVRTEAPIFAEEEVIAKAGIPFGAPH